MMDWSDSHCRNFWRLLTANARLYTEMITTGALLRGDSERHLAFKPTEHPIALQLGGSSPKDLATASQLGEQAGYDEINLNVGCPSDRVSSGEFGASLMLKPELVADCIAAMRDSISVPVTVKCRIGVDDTDSYDELCHFVSLARQSGCSTFIVHARKAWLSGLSPKQNREIPPLSYPTVHSLKQDFPELSIILNGGIKTLEQCSEHLESVDGLMIGREAYQNPMMLAGVDNTLFGDSRGPASAMDAALAYSEYMREQLGIGARLHHMTRHVLGLFSGLPGARSYRRHLSTHANREDASIDVFLQALEFVGKRSRKNG